MAKRENSEKLRSGGRTAARGTAESAAGRRKAPRPVRCAASNILAQGHC
jgi:hypothetical protein